jgi:nucleotide-binding universal stress UspA family protein
MSAPAPLDIRNILVATDFSRGSDSALSAAIALAQQFGARLHLLHVVPTALMRPAAQDRLGQIARAHEEGVPLRTFVTDGRPASGIVDYATRESVDLIVVGTHGRTGLGHAVMGSVAEAVVQTAPCQVLTIPLRAESQRAEAGPPRETVVAEEGATRARCLVCARPSDDRICEACAMRVRGQALERLVAEEKAGGGGSGR